MKLVPRFQPNRTQKARGGAWLGRSTYYTSPYRRDELHFPVSPSWWGEATGLRLCAVLR